MILKRFTLIFVITIVTGFVLSTCTSFHPNIQNDAVTSTISPQTATRSPTKTDFWRSFITSTTCCPYKSSTTSPFPATQTPWPKVTPKGRKLLPLSKYMLTAKDIILNESTYPDGEIYHLFFESNITRISDVSSELTSICAVNCTKQVWETDHFLSEGMEGNYFDVYEKVIIAMFLSKNETDAKRIAQNIYDQFIPHSYTYEGDEGSVFSNIASPLENTKVAITSLQGRQYILLTTSDGPITIWTMKNINGDFAAWHIDIAVYFTNLQLKKLHEGGLIP